MRPERDIRRCCGDIDFIVATLRDDDNRLLLAGSKNWSEKETRRCFLESFSSAPALRLRFFRIDGDWLFSLELGAISAFNRIYFVLTLGLLMTILMSSHI